ncbi:HDOD domain-containing protein [Malonomonas rubra]|uniref:HDOD domain-containing protein n=1 Tax=Malonomonas rubra TaxID=57040 RepID=UPI0026EE80B0|nr:HDOD domain-containing protein [Malonomonas rubra]
MNRVAIPYSEQAVAKLLCMPQVLVSLIESCLAGSSTQTLADIVLRDAALCARVIQAASKGGTVEIDPVEPVTSSIQQLGTPVLTGIALQAAKQIVAHEFSPAALTYLNNLWFSAGVAGQVARCLAPTVGYLHIEEAQLCGLLLNLGMQLQFSSYGGTYAELAEQACCSPELCALEQEVYQTNHLQIAVEVIDAWRLDSFLVDAIRFLHNDVAEIESCGQLLKIARLAQEVCRQPQQLSSSTAQLAENLFQFSRSECDYLFRWAHGLYQSKAPANDIKQLFAELKQTKGALVDLIFALADQEGARARLLGANRPEELVREARALYLENCSANEAVFLLVDHKNDQLSGIVAAGQTRLVSELKIPLDASLSLVVQSLIRGEVISSFETEQKLSITDQLLTRICGNKGFCCQPFRLDGRPLGAVVLGVSGKQDQKDLRSLRMQMFGQVVSEAVAQLSNGVQDRFSEGNGLLRRVSHELSSPLTIIGNYAEVISHLLVDEEHRKMAGTIKREVRRVDDVLTYYLNQQELPPFPDKNVSLNQLVYEAVDVLQESDLQPRQIEVRFDLKDDLERVVTNGTLVKQVLVNLLKNAAEAVAAGGEIVLKTRDSFCIDGGRYAEIVVQDNSAGIERQLQNKLFRPVVSTKGPGHAGVSLSIVKGMVDDLGARMSYHSSPTSGTCFHLQIPLGDDIFPAVE